MKKILALILALMICLSCGAAFAEATMSGEVKAVEETAANHSMTVKPEVWDSYIAQVQADLEALKKEGC